MNIRTFADSVLITLAAKLALIVLPFVAGASVFFGAAWLDGRFELITVSLGVLQIKVEELEKSDVAKGSELSGLGQRVEFQKQLFDRIGAVEGKLQQLDVTLTSLISVLRDREARGGRTERGVGQ